MKQHWIVGLGLSALAGFASATPSITAQVEASAFSVNLSGVHDKKSSAGSTTQSLQAASSVSESNFAGSSTASAATSAFVIASPGGLRMLATASAQAVTTDLSPMTAAGGSTVYATLDDGFTIVAGQCGNLTLCGDGAIGQMSFSIVVDGSMGGSGTAGFSIGGRWEAGFSLTTGAPLGLPVQSYANWRGWHNFSQQGTAPPVESQLDGFGVRNYTVSFVFGAPITLHLDDFINAQANATTTLGNATATFTTDMSHTFAWGGISSVKDSAGNTIAFSALNADGSFDYAQSFTSSVPEPSSALLLGAGLLGLLLRRRAR